MCSFFYVKIEMIGTDKSVENLFSEIFLYLYKT